MEYIKEYKEYLNNNFWEWFGDSKVVDVDGNPMVCYHATQFDFDKFICPVKENTQVFSLCDKFDKDIDKILRTFTK